MPSSDAMIKRPMRRGLSALMADVGVDRGDAVGRTAGERQMPIEKVHPNPDQPRRAFDEEALSDLAASIVSRGIIQPLIVRSMKDRPGEVEIVAGERRWRAAQRAGLHAVPVIQREFDDVEVLEVAILENIQRTDLNAIEEGQGFRQLMDRFGHTQEKLAEVLGKSRSHVANLMRLLKLPEEVQEMLRTGALSAGHARALVTSDDPAALARRVVAKGLSVRETERLAKSASSSPSPRSKPSAKDPDTAALEADLSAASGLAVSIEHKASGKGRVVVAYDTLDGLDAACRLLSSGRFDQSTSE